MLIKTAAQTLSEQLASVVAQRIRDRLLSPGARLPSVRLCAQQQGVSPSTVVAAYDQLLAQGLVEARRNRGFYVRGGNFMQKRPPEPMDTAQAAINSGANGDTNANANANANAHANGPPSDASAPVGAQVSTDPAASLAGLASGSILASTFASIHPPPLNATALIRGMFRGVSNKPQPGMGVLPQEWLRTSFLATAVRRSCNVEAMNAFSLQYGEPAGDSSLRRALSTKLAGLSVHVAPEHITTTVGATQALDVVSRTLLRAGDYVMVEEPGWAIEFARLDALGMRILPVPRHADGPDLAVMARYCEVHRPKLFVSVSVYHNPTGYCLSPGSAHRILQLANQHDFHIVEDDTYSHFAPEHATRLCALDGLQRTIYVAGFAKILAPNWRIGYLAAPADLSERLLDTKLLSTLTTPALLEKAMAWCIDQGQLRRHAQRIRSQLDAARSRSVKLALAHGCTFASEPAGLFGWVQTGVDTERLSQRMLDEGYLLAPGALFHAQHAPSSLMRINFASTQEPQFWQTFARLRDE